MRCLFVSVYGGSGERIEKFREEAHVTADNETGKKRGSAGKKIVIIVIAAVVIIAAAGGIYMGSLNKAYQADSDRMVIVEVPQGSSTSSIADILEEKGVIRSASRFKLKSRLSGNDGKYLAGVYELGSAMTPEEIMRKLMSGEQEQTKLTIPEGYTLTQVAETVEKAGLCTADEFLSETQNGAFDYRFMEYAGSGEKRLEGFLYPETYFIPKGMEAHDIVDMMLRQFDVIFTDEDYSRAEELDLTPRDVVTVASMIQRETRVESEGAKVASVIYNRLAVGMKLQIDATVQYALGEQKDRLSYSDLKIDSPYNTYVVEGLPAGPICQPHESAIQAALYPETTEYLFYVLKPDGSGQHNFAATDAEFETYRQQYLSSLD